MFFFVIVGSRTVSRLLIGEVLAGNARLYFYISKRRYRIFVRCFENLNSVRFAFSQFDSRVDIESTRMGEKLISREDS